jgi:membrane fusion protein, heavy metal efflux system
MPAQVYRRRILFPLPWLAGASLSLALLLVPVAAIAHGGHGDEFQGGTEATSATSIKVDAETAKRIGLKVEPVTLRQLAFGTQSTGQIEASPSRKVEVTNPAGGTVVRLFVQPGDDVQQGQALAVITSGELAELRVDSLERSAETAGTVQEAQTNLQLAQQTYDRQAQISQTAIAQAQTDLRIAQEQFDRDQELTTKGALPRRDFLESEANLAAAQTVLAEAQSRIALLEMGAERDRAQSALEVAQSRAELSTANYDTRLQQLGADANEDGTITITAPIAGRIADREVSLGQSAEDAGSALMTIIDDSTVLASANVYEKDLKQVAIGQRVRVKVSGLPKRTFAGVVTVVGAVVEGDTRVIPVKAELENADGALKPGMFAEVEIVSATRSKPVLAVPQSALSEVKGQPVVYVQNGDGYQPIEVTLGKTAGEWVEVKDGVFEGDRIVTQRVAQLYAQSLRGGGKPAADQEEAAAPSASTGQLPWWVMLSVGSGVAVGAFWLGQKSRQGRFPKLLAGSEMSGSEQFSTAESSLASGNSSHGLSSSNGSAKKLTRNPQINLPHSPALDPEKDPQLPPQ